ncbi:MAG: hypothetical protein LBN29_11300 [Mediterranea sp.]|jgi:hypothetical protein|nr:hypothetical protein [Mediterranea sp.]
MKTMFTILKLLLFALPVGIIVAAIVLAIFCEEDATGFHLTQSGSEDLGMITLIGILAIAAAYLDKNRHKEKLRNH